MAHHGIFKKAKIDYHNHQIILDKTIIDLKYHELYHQKTHIFY